MALLFRIALENAWFEAELPVLTGYDAYRIGWRLFKAGEWEGHKLKRLPAHWDEQAFLQAIYNLVEAGELAFDNDFKSYTWRFVRTGKAATPAEIACVADPFCYLSHASALEHYKFGALASKALYLTIPARQLWSDLRDKKIREDFGETSTRHRQYFHYTGFTETLRWTNVYFWEAKHLGETHWAPKTKLRVTTIGQTFVDTLAQPERCGGMATVVQVWKDAARRHLDEIIDAISKEETKIIKVRAGYILSEYLGIKNANVESWKTFAQRGGSRKLDPQAPYAPTFSEAWMLSLNCEL